VTIMADNHSVEGEERTAFSFRRTKCGCGDCTINCKYLPGYLLPEDLVRIARSLGYANLGQFAFDHLLASPGATVMSEGRVFQIPTLVPRRKEDGSCKFLDEKSRCTIHAVSPYGCAFFDAHQSGAEADRRSSRGLQEIARHWAGGAGPSAYVLLWRLLYAAGLRAIPAQVARAKMREEIEAAQMDPKRR
jgi:Fe-S-cluster containining protein